MIENENPSGSLLNPDPITTVQVPSNEPNSLLNPETKEQNAFQTMQKQINSYKAELEKITKDFEEYKTQNNLVTVKKDETLNPVTPVNDNIITEVSKVLNNFKTDIDKKLGTITNTFQQQDTDTKIDSLNGILSQFADNFGMTPWQVKNFVNAMDVSGSGFANTLEGKMNFLLQYVDTPKLIEMELIKVSPKDIETALARKQAIDAKTVNKQQSAVVRAGEYNQTVTNSNSVAQNKVQQFFDNEYKKVELKITGKAY